MTVKFTLDNTIRIFAKNLSKSVARFFRLCYHTVKCESEGSMASRLVKLKKTLFLAAGVVAKVVFSSFDECLIPTDSIIA